MKPVLAQRLRTGVGKCLARNRNLRRVDNTLPMKTKTRGSQCVTEHEISRMIIGEYSVICGQSTFTGNSDQLTFRLPQGLKGLTFDVSQIVSTTKCQCLHLRKSFDNPCDITKNLPVLDHQF
ncbi:hypothetical protein PRAC110570_04465 [Propionibacterium acidifaciens]